MTTDTKHDGPVLRGAHSATAHDDLEVAWATIWSAVHQYNSVAVAGGHPGITFVAFADETHFPDVGCCASAGGSCAACDVVLDASESWQALVTAEATLANPLEALEEQNCVDCEVVVLRAFAQDTSIECICPSPEDVSVPCSPGCAFCGT